MCTYTIQHFFGVRDNIIAIIHTNVLIVFGFLFIFIFFNFFCFFFLNYFHYRLATVTLTFFDINILIPLYSADTV